jgi:hypothetical protein
MKTSSFLKALEEKCLFHIEGYCCYHDVKKVCYNICNKYETKKEVSKND